MSTLLRARSSLVLTVAAQTPDHPAIVGLLDIMLSNPPPADLPSDSIPCGAETRARR